jgi:peptidoglycan/LPS O-acetylase OafA/YrhL
MHGRAMATTKTLHGLTSLRGIAAWWVAIYHFREYLPHGLGHSTYDFFACGYLAVDLFFEMSGFVIALNYDIFFRNLKISETVAFLSARIARIYPLHISILFLFLLNPIAIDLFSQHHHAGARYDPLYFVLSLALIQNWGFTSGLAWNIPAWSISTEWFAYLLFPGFAWVSARYVRGVRRTAGLAVVLLVLLGAGARLAGGSLGADIQGFGLLRCILEFCIGVCLFRFWSCREVKPPHEGNAAAALAVILILCYVVFPIPDFTVMPLGFACLIYALSDSRSVLSRLLSFRALEAVGVVSYSTYLVHYFVKDWVKFLLADGTVPGPGLILVYIAVVAAASCLLYRCIEVPGRRALRAAAKRALSGGIAREPAA